MKKSFSILPLLICLLLLFTMPACKKQKCPTYMTKEEVEEMHKKLIEAKIKPVKRDKRGLVKKKNPNL
jgi:type III secretory pathway lipoprotein EscJ